MLIMNQPPSVGDIIHEMYLKPSGLSIKDAATLCNLSEEALRQIISGEQKLGYELALKLSKGFNTSHTFWLNIQEDAETKV